MGSVGAGTGAVVAGWRGFEHLRKGGVGSHSERVGDATVGALVVLNAVGDVFTLEGVSLTGGDHAPVGPPVAPKPLQNTTLAVVATDARMDRSALLRIAVQAHDAMAVCLRPSHTLYDGDAAFAVSCGAVVADHDALGAAAFRRGAIDRGGTTPRRVAGRRSGGGAVVTSPRILLEELGARAAVCTACTLAETRTHVVFADGSPEADLMFVGEAPGSNEDLQGVPFVGAAGKLLDRLLGEIGIERKDVYIANVIKCRPRATVTRVPRRSTRARTSCVSSLPWSTRVVVTLGNFATKLLLKRDVGITRLRGQAYPWWNRQLVPIPSGRRAACRRAGAYRDASGLCTLLPRCCVPHPHRNPFRRTQSSWGCSG